MSVDLIALLLCDEGDQCKNFLYNYCTVVNIIRNLIENCTIGNSRDYIPLQLLSFNLLVNILDLYLFNILSWNVMNGYYILLPIVRRRCST